MLQVTYSNYSGSGSGCRSGNQNTHYSSKTVTAGQGTVGKKFVGR